MPVFIMNNLSKLFYETLAPVAADLYFPVPLIHSYRYVFRSVTFLVQSDIESNIVARLQRFNVSWEEDGSTDPSS